MMDSYDYKGKLVIRLLLDIPSITETLDGSLAFAAAGPRTRINQKVLTTIHCLTRDEAAAVYSKFKEVNENAVNPSRVSAEWIPDSFYLD